MDVCLQKNYEEETKKKKNRKFENSISDAFNGRFVYDNLLIQNN